MTTKPELLAPAGNAAAVRAAAAGGADAIYLGLGEFNARRSADNFTYETLEEACRFAHLRGIRVYLTLNVVILDDELERALDMVAQAWARGIDAVIVQDLGVLRVLRAALPEVRVHASTQMNVHSTDSLRALAALGVSRITLARETSLAEIRSFSHTADTLGAEVESFTHGALCMSYSGQCLLSSMIGGRSANRGMCAQPCRLPYELEDSAGTKLGAVGSYLLSPKDLAGIPLLGRLIGSGVHALKLEGRMKSAEYVALVTGVYRSALDRAAVGADVYEVRNGEMAVLSEAFSRGFTQAYLLGHRDNPMMSYQRPNNRGVLVGRLVSAEGMRAVIALESAVDSEDTIQVWTGRGRFTQQLGPLEFEGSSHSTAPAGARVTVSLSEMASPGDRVFRVRNAQLSDAANRIFSDVNSPKVPLDFHVRVVVGSDLEVSVTDTRGRTAVARGDRVEAARTKTVTSAEIVDHVGRLGGSAYEARGWDVELSPGAGISYSALHAVRRAALAQYEHVVLGEWDRDAAREVAFPSIPNARDGAPVRNDAPALAVSVDGLEAAWACLEAGAQHAHVPAWALRGADVDARIVPVVPRICHDDECAAYIEIASAYPTCVAGTLGSLWRLAQTSVSVHAHWSLNALNRQAIAQLAELGAAAVWLSPELAATQVAKLAEKPVVPLGIALAGAQELMVTEHCILMAEGPCAQTCAECARRRSPRYLRDRKGYRFPVVTDPVGRSHLYNAVPLDLTASLPDILGMGLAHVRLDLETLSPSEAARETTRVHSALGAALSARPVDKPGSAVTTGHFYRGIR